MVRYYFYFFYKSKTLRPWSYFGGGMGSGKRRILCRLGDRTLLGIKTWV